MNDPNLTPIHRLTIAAAVLLTLLTLGACVSARPAPAFVPDCDPDLCNITGGTWRNHIKPQHCDSDCEEDKESIFEATWCRSLEEAKAFCKALTAFLPTPVALCLATALLAGATWLVAWAWVANPW